MKLRALVAALGLSVALLANIAAEAQPTAEHSESQTYSGPTIIFDFVRSVPGAPVPKYTLTIHDDGAGSYAGEAAPPMTHYAAPVSSAAIPFQRNIRITRATTAHIFDLAARLGHFKAPCASKAKNIADTGAKTISYTGPDGPGSCTYNYTEIKELVALTELIQGITQTLDAGRELDHLHRYDRLGLDAAMTSLQQEAMAGRALELGMIGDSLRTIAGDPDVLARVRAKASTLLARSDASE